MRSGPNGMFQEFELFSAGSISLASTLILNSLGQARPTTSMAEDLLGIGTHNEAYARFMQRLHEEV